ncbi:MAG: ABC transporter permease [Chloroflexi bacterium]|nr:ABC transporter permease [Chloroflexota bacterium]
MQKERRNQLVNTFLVPFLAVITGLLFAALLILFTDASPIEAFSELISAAFGCKSITSCAFLTTLERATPLILTGLGAVVAFRSGMFSIGQEGQLLMGAVTAAYLGYAIHLPYVIHPIVIILASMTAGGIYGWVPGVLKVKLGVNEVITTIVMNTIATLVMEYLVNFPMRGDISSTAHSPVIDATAQLPAFLPGSKWGIGFVIAIVVAIAVYFFLWRSTSGYEQRMAGQAPFFAKFGGIKNDKIAIRGMVISGAICGLAGAIEILGVNRRIMTGYSTGLGFDGLSVAILGQTHPLGVVIVAIIFAGLRLGAQLGLQLSLGIPRELGGGMIAIMILFVAAGQLYVSLIENVRKWKEKRKKPGEGDLIPTNPNGGKA